MHELLRPPDEVICFGVEDGIAVPALGRELLSAGAQRKVGKSRVSYGKSYLCPGIVGQYEVASSPEPCRAARSAASKGSLDVWSLDVSAK